MFSSELFDGYRTTIDGETCYFAGLPGYPGNFSRDTFIASIIAADQGLISSQLPMSAAHQGQKFDGISGEEPGKIHHEYPGVVVHEPYLSTYNACDTTSFFLIGLEMLRRLDQDAYESESSRYINNVHRAVEYLDNHVRDDIFLEFPPEGTEHFSLHTTYWKDSIVPSSDGNEEPNYPVAYALAHFQAARGLLAASRLLDREDLADKATRMYQKGIGTFVLESDFCLEQDETHCLLQASSDELHALAYIPREFKDALPLEAMRERAGRLVTPAGFACTPEEISDKLKDTYHGYVVWIFEQALIHYGCTKFGLDDMAEITLRCREYINEGQELVSVKPEIAPLGNNHQLWSVAADIYFSDAHSLRQTDWL